MKKAFTIICMISTLAIYSQGFALGVSSGIVKGGLGHQLVGNFYNDNVIAPRYFQLGFMRADATLLNDQGYSLDNVSYQLSLGHFHNLPIFKEDRRKVSWALGYGLHSGHDQLTPTDGFFQNGAVFQASDNQINYGLFLGSELEFYTTTASSIFIRANQYYKINSNFNTFPYYVAGGVQFFF